SANFSSQFFSLSYISMRTPPHVFAPQHFLYFWPDPHGQGSLRPTFCPLRTAVTTAASSDGPVNWTARGARVIRGASSLEGNFVIKMYLTISSSMRFIISSNKEKDSFLYSIKGSR